MPRVCPTLPVFSTTYAPASCLLLYFACAQQISMKRQCCRSHCALLALPTSFVARSASSTFAPICCLLFYFASAWQTSMKRQCCRSHLRFACVAHAFASTWLTKHIVCSTTCNVRPQSVIERIRLAFKHMNMEKHADRQSLSVPEKGEKKAACTENVDLIACICICVPACVRWAQTNWLCHPACSDVASMYCRRGPHRMR